MTFVFLVLSLIVAAALVAPLWLARRPEEGWLRWLAGSLDGFLDLGTGATDARLEDLLSDPDNRTVPGYTTVEELREMLETRVRR